jgi:glyoxylase-like metal-dependent hydrolase (beta-lactamase superfamily II)
MADQGTPISIDTMMFGLPRSTAAHLVPASRPALVDVGSDSTVPAVTAALSQIGVDRLEAIVLTHIHFDHAGGAGQLARRFEDVPVYAPERVIKHLIDPGRLTEGVRSVWGDQTETLFGLPEPVPSDRVVPLKDGDRIDLGDRSLLAIATPGHTRAHLSYLDESSGALICGDALGINLPNFDVVRPATPPADFSLEESLGSIERIRKSGASEAYAAHFGLVPGDLDRNCDRAATALERWWEMFERERFEAHGEEDLLRRVHCALEADLEPIRPGQRRTLETVNPAWLNLSGMSIAASRVGPGA